MRTALSSTVRKQPTSRAPCESTSTQLNPASRFVGGETSRHALIRGVICNLDIKRSSNGLCGGRQERETVRCSMLCTCANVLQSESLSRFSPCATTATDIPERHARETRKERQVILNFLTGS